LPKRIYICAILNFAFFQLAISHHTRLSLTGPLLRLANGHGWLFEKKHGDKMMERVPVEQGLWAYRVNNQDPENGGVGLALRAHPTTSSDMVLEGDILCPHGYVVWADAKVVSGGTTYVCIQGTTGWLFTRREGKDTLLPVANSANATAIVAAAPTTPPREAERSLTANALRAVASRRGLQEVQYNEVSRVIAFTKEDGNGGTARVNVYYTTGTVGTTLNHPRQGKTQMFRPNCGLRDIEEIMTNPRVHTGKGYKRCQDIAGLLDDARRGGDAKRIKVEGGGGVVEFGPFPHLHLHRSHLRLRRSSIRTYPVGM
jgi:hypothetical protein